MFVKSQSLAKKILVILRPVDGIEVKCLSQKLWRCFCENKKEEEAHSADERESLVHQLEWPLLPPISLLKFMHLYLLKLESSWENGTPFMEMYCIPHFIPSCSGSRKMGCMDETSPTMASTVLTQAAICLLEVRMCCMNLLQVGTPTAQSFMMELPARTECEFSLSSLACVES